MKRHPNLVCVVLLILSLPGLTSKARESKNQLLYYLIQPGDNLTIILNSIGYYGKKRRQFDFLIGDKTTKISDHRQIKAGWKLVLENRDITFNCNVRVQDDGRVLLKQRLYNKQKLEAFLEETQNCRRNISITTEPAPIKEKTAPITKKIRKNKKRKKNNRTKRKKQSLHFQLFARTRAFDLVDNTTFSRGEVYTKENPGLELAWNRLWRHKLTSELSIRLQHLRLLGIPQKSIVHQKIFLWQITAKAFYKWKKWLGPFVGVGLGQEVYVTAPDNATLRMNRTTTPHLITGGRFQWESFNGGSFLGVDLGGKWVSPSKVQGDRAKYGKGIFGRAFFDFKLNKKFKIKNSITIENTQKNTRKFNQTHLVIEYGLGLLWEF